MIFIKRGYIMEESVALKEFAKEICELLEIEIPTIIYDDSVFLTNTQLGGIDLNTNILYLRNNYKTKFDELFAIAYELRHMYQNKSILWRNSLYSRRKNNESSTEYYNNQESELDANAFAAYVMMDRFKIKPLFTGLDKITKRKIFKRVDDIKKEIRIHHKAD